MALSKPWGSLTSLATRMRYTAPALRAYEPEDLVQEVLTRALEQLESFRGAASLETWVLTLARNLLVDMARAAKIRPALDEMAEIPARGGTVVETLCLRTEAQVLMDWLRSPEGCRAVPWGWQAFKLLLRSHGNVSYVALSLTVLSKKSWTTERVRALVRKIRQTRHGSTLCTSLGLSDR